MRESGILLPVFSLPSNYGIGCFSKEAYEFVDQLCRAGQKKWQILPLGPTGFGDSPYQSFSTFAGNPYFIDLETMTERGLLTKSECDGVDLGTDEVRIDYGKLYQSRGLILRKAYERFEETKEFHKFRRQNQYWLEDYCLYMAEKQAHGGIPWMAWEDGIKYRNPDVLEKEKVKLKEEIRFQCFQQYEFFRQWDELHRYANGKEIQIIGDIPIYVAFDSADTWAHPELFQLDEKKAPLAVAGCPPDGFSATGQLWGNPLYNWEYHKKTDYEWWRKRMHYHIMLYDVVRIDHFRGFDEYYSIPAGMETAENGEWKEGPGIAFFQRLKQEIGDSNIIAEDLGYLTDSVRELVSQSGYPGMKLLEFAFDSREASNYLPHNYDHHCVVYTGTHDNNTLQGWLDDLDEADLRFAMEYMDNEDTPRELLHLDFVRMALASVADLCVIPIQDYLGLGREARINHPSTIGKNWTWRLKKGQITDIVIENIRKLTSLYGR